MPGFVVDASVAAAWALSDETTSATDALLVRVRDEGGLVPALWRWEVANLLLTAVRRGRATREDALGHLHDFALLPIVVDQDAAASAWRETFALAAAHAVTAYDAAYLELASRTGLPLATKDEDLRKAAKAIGVAVLP